MLVVDSLSDVMWCDAMRRDMIWHQNIVRFSEEIKGIFWDNSVDKQIAQEAYSAFHEIEAENYNLCFPIKKCYNKNHGLQVL